MHQPNAFDAIVIGGGHNGLIAGSYLSRRGARVMVLEARDRIGGAADTSSPWPEHPDWRVNTYSYTCGLLSQRVRDDLELARYGLALHPAGPFYQAFPDGRSLRVWADRPSATREEVAKFSARDADALEGFDQWIGDVVRVLFPLLTQVPPRLGSLRFGDLLEQAQLAWSFRGLGERGVATLTQLFTMSIADVLDRWFESDEIKASFTPLSVIGAWAGPYEPGTAYVLMHHLAADVPGGNAGAWAFPEGGMGGVSQAILRSGQAHGMQVRTRAKVARILTVGDRARGVVLTSGEELTATTIVTSVHPQLTFLRFLDPGELPDAFVRDIRAWRSRSGCVKVNLVLSELPDFIADPGTDLQEHHTGYLEYCLSMDHVERAFEDARNGRAAVMPYGDANIPTTLDRTLMPEGLHQFSIFTQYVPSEWNLEPHRDELEAYADRLIDGYTALAPNLKSSIVARQVLGPYDMEQDLGMIGGNIFHGELSVDQLFHMRPAPGYADYRSPIPGLYHASSATHGGGGVTGIPGYQAVRQILRDRKERARR